MSAKTEKAETPWTPKKVEETKAEVLRRATRDAEFRQRCLKNASAAIKEVSGLELPHYMPPLRFVDRLEELVIVLPPLVGAEVSDQDLDLVAGGVDKNRREGEQKGINAVLPGIAVTSDQKAAY